MLTFLTLVPEPSSPWSAELIEPAAKPTDAGQLDYFTKYDIGKFLCNYETSSVDSMSIDSDIESDLECDLEDANYPRPSSGALLHLLTNSLILAHVAPFISAVDKLNMAATSKAFFALIHGTPYAFKYLDLTRLQRFGAAQATAPPAVSANVLRPTPWCELPEYRLGPYHDVFSHLHNSRWLSSVNTLILDSTNVEAELVCQLLTSPSCNVRILSLRNTPLLNKDTLCAFLKTLCSQTGQGNIPKLKGLYLFGKDASDGASDLWYRERGRVMTPSKEDGDGEMWASTLMACRGKIAFDGVLCNGARHASAPGFGKVSGIDIDSTDLELWRIPLSHLPPGRPDTEASMATFSLDGCAGCGSAPEGWTTWGDDQVAGRGDAVSQFPMLWPPPRMSTNVRVAMCPDGESLHPHRTQHEPSRSRFIARCEWCVYGRQCACCMRWWCESCLPDSAAHGLVNANEPLMKYSCRECGSTCPDCLAKTEKNCQRCRQPYCVVHNVGCTSTHCDWCNATVYAPQPPLRRAALSSWY